MCVGMGWAATVRPHNTDPHPAYSTATVSPTLIIQSPEENLILCNPPPPLSYPPYPLLIRKIVTKRTRRGADSEAEEEAEPRRSNGGGTTPPVVSGSCRRGFSSWRRWELRGAGRRRGVGPPPRPQPGQMLLNGYKREAEVIPSNYVLLSAGGKLGADKNGGDGGSADGGI